jgi:ADP-ribose pyrophosphatase YjhB (NUDIX family)
VTKRLMSEEEIGALTRQFGEPRRRSHTIEVNRETYDRWMQKIHTGPVSCRGEVIMVIVRPNGKVLLHTKDFYPPGVYRLLSGRVLWQEKIEEALHNEVAEETSLDVRVEQFLGVIEYEFCCKGESIPFISYVFQLQELGGELCCRDHQEGIAGFREAMVGELPGVAEQLESLVPQWRDWGGFRAIAHRFVEEMLRVERSRPSSEEGAEAL